MKDRGLRWLWLDRVHDLTCDETLSQSASHVALALAVYYMNGSSEAWPSQQTLAASTHRSQSTVKRALHELETQGLLEIRRGPPAQTSGNVYRLAAGSETSEGA